MSRIEDIESGLFAAYDGATEQGKSDLDGLVSAQTLVIGGEYNFKNQPERLKYIGVGTGASYGWHQFEKIGIQGVWCELLDDDLYMIERTLSH